MVNSIPVPDKTKYYPGGGALFEYNANTRTLTRLSVPEGRRETTFTLPPDSHLHGLGIGAERNQPLTLFLERRKNSESERFGDFIITVWDADCTVLVANSETFRTQGWTQPQAWSAKPDLGGLREVVLGMGGGLISRGASLVHATVLCWSFQSTSSSSALAMPLRLPIRRTLTFAPCTTARNKVDRSQGLFRLLVRAMFTEMVSKRKRIFKEARQALAAGIYLYPAARVLAPGIAMKLRPSKIGGRFFASTGSWH